MGSLKYDNQSMDRLLLGMALPIILKLLIGELYAMVDTYFVGTYLGHGALAALSLSFPMQRLLFALAVLVGVGTSTSLSRNLGRKEYDQASRTIVSGGFLLLCIQIPIALVTALYPQQIMALFGAQGNTLIGAAGYLRYTAIGSVFLALSTFLSYVLLSLGNTKFAMVSMILGALGNALFDLVFLGVLRMDVASAGLASMMSQTIAGVFILISFLTFLKKREIKLKLHFSMKLFPLLFLGGLAAFVVEVEDSIVMTVLNKLLLSSVGEEGVIILGVVTKLSMFLFITLFGVASAMQPIAAYYYGAKNKKKLKELLHKTLIYSFGFTFVIWLLFQFKAESFVAIFLKDPVYVKKAAKTLRIVLGLFPLTSIYYLGIFYHQAKGDVKRALIESLLRQILILLPLALILSKGLGLGAMGVWIAFPLTDGLASLFAFLGFKSQGLLTVLLRGEKSADKKRLPAQKGLIPVFEAIASYERIEFSKKGMKTIESLAPR